MYGFVVRCDQQLGRWMGKRTKGRSHGIGGSERIGADSRTAAITLVMTPTRKAVTKHPQWAEQTTGR
jgi:hypothetical protein